MDDYEKNVTKGKVIKTFLIAIAAILVCFIVGITGFTIFFLSSTNSKSNYLNVKAVAPSKDGQVNILVAGVDVGSNDSASATSVNSTKKDNSIILFSYNQKSNKLTAMYIPRDTLISKDSDKQKISYANSVDGPKYLVSSVENLMNIKVNYYAGFDYAAFRSIIDAIGGIDISINNDMNYDDNVQNLHIRFTSGSTVHMNGQKAEEFYRWVKNNDGKGLLQGDLGRIKNQQIVAETVMKKFTRASTIFSYPKIISVISKNVETNMSTNQIIKYARAFASLKKDDISVCTAKGLNVTVDSEKYYLNDAVSNKKLLSSSTAASKTESVDKSTVKMLIWNGTNTNGLAKNYKDKLTAKGFANITTGNAPKKPVDTTTITFYNMDDAKLISTYNALDGTIKAGEIVLIPGKGSVKNDILITLGSDISGK